MRKYILLIALGCITLLFIPFVLGDTDTKPHPILDWSDRLIGGTWKGKWLNRDEMAKYLNGGEKYKLYSQEKFLGELPGCKPHQEQYLSGDNGYRIEIEGKERLKNADVVGVSGDWNALPRIPKIDKPASDKIIQNDPFIKEVLEKNGIHNIPIQIQTRIAIDLENDGVMETLIVASNITSKMIDDFADGRDITRDNLYSLIILRKTLNGKEQNTVITASFKEFTFNEIAFMADIDGDGQMEFLIRINNLEVLPAEGFATEYQDLYDIDKKTVKKLCSNFANPI